MPYIALAVALLLLAGSAGPSSQLAWAGQASGTMLAFDDGDDRYDDWDDDDFYDGRDLDDDDDEFDEDSARGPDDDDEEEDEWDSEGMRSVRA